MTDRPWETEPDRLDFEAEGLPCAMRRNHHGVWCGYVGVGEGHPLYGLPTNHPLKLPPSWFDNRRLDQGVGPMDILIHMLSGAKSIEDACPISLAFHVHGGITFDGHGSTLPDGYWWFGFDCGHAGDFAPGVIDLKPLMNQMINSMPENVRAKMREIVFADKGVYRDQEYVVSECQSLAAQLIAVVGVIEGEKHGCTDDRDHRA